MKLHKILAVTAGLTLAAASGVSAQSWGGHSHGGWSGGFFSRIVGHVTSRGWLGSGRHGGGGGWLGGGGGRHSGWHGSGGGCVFFCGGGGGHGGGGGGGGGGGVGADVPLPASSILLVAGLGAFAVARRRKKKAD